MSLPSVYWEMGRAIKDVRARTGDDTWSLSINQGRALVVKVVNNGKRKAPTVNYLTGALLFADAIAYLNAQG